jgi:ring-1,2-phenylacetyl-CoA epoxidase subunit PaaC
MPSCYATSCSTNSSLQPLANFAKKVKGELKYHVMHADTWLRQLSNGTEESKARMQSALQLCWPYALGIFETTESENELISSGVFVGEKHCKHNGSKEVSSILENAGLNIPTVADDKIVLGGRKGFHSEHLAPLLAEMTEVTNIDVSAEW